MDFLITPYVALMMEYNLSYSAAFLVWYTVEFVLIMLLMIITVSLSILFKKFLYEHFCGRKIKNIFGLYFKIFIDFFRNFKKEEIMPFKSDKFLFWTAPIIVLTPTIFVWCLIPFAANFQAIKTDAGALLFIAFTLISSWGVMLCGYASKNNFSIWGAYRACLQIISFLVPMLLSVMSVVLLAGSMNLKTIIEQQYNFGCLSWFCVPAFIGVCVFFVSMLAVINSRPFDLSTADNELVSGYKTEISGIKFAMLNLAEEILTVIFAIYCVVIFFGGYLSPIHFSLADIFAGSKFWYSFILTAEQIFLILLKTSVLLYVINLIKVAFPIIRPDKAALFGWKYLVPLSLINLLLVCLIKQGGFYA